MNTFTRTTSHSQQRITNEDGFAAIVIAIVLVTVLGLLTVGFAQLMQRAQKDTLKRQLSSSAYYAAESGINDAEKALKDGYLKPKTTCDPLVGATGPGQYLTSNVVDTAGTSGVKYTCLLIDPAPFDLQFSSVGAQDDNGRVFKVTGIDPTDPNETTPASINELTISWQDETKNTHFAPNSWYNSANAQFPKLTDWTNGGLITGIISLAIVPLGDLNRASLTANTYNAYLYPVATAGAGLKGSSDYNSGTGQNGGQVVDGKCNAANTPRYCSVTISGLNQSQYLVRMASIYNTSTMTVTARNTFSGPVRLSGVQAVVDSTGNAQGVLRRVQVRIPDQNYDYPQYGLEAGAGICKLLSVEPTGAASSNGCP